MAAKRLPGSHEDDTNDATFHQASVNSAISAVASPGHAVRDFARIPLYTVLIVAHVSALCCMACSAVAFWLFTHLLLRLAIALRKVYNIPEEIDAQTRERPNGALKATAHEHGGKDLVDSTLRERNVSEDKSFLRDETAERADLSVSNEEEPSYEGLETKREIPCHLPGEIDHHAKRMQIEQRKAEAGHDNATWDEHATADKPKASNRPEIDEGLVLDERWRNGHCWERGDACEDDDRSEVDQRWNEEHTEDDTVRDRSIASDKTQASQASNKSMVAETCFDADTPNHLTALSTHAAPQLEDDQRYTTGSTNDNTGANGIASKPDIKAQQKAAQQLAFLKSLNPAATAFTGTRPQAPTAASKPMPPHLRATSDKPSGIETTTQQTNPAQSQDKPTLRGAAPAYSPAQLAEAAALMKDATRPGPSARGKTPVRASKPVRKANAKNLTPSASKVATPNVSAKPSQPPPATHTTTSAEPASENVRIAAPPGICVPPHLRKAIEAQIAADTFVTITADDSAEELSIVAESTMGYQHPDLIDLDFLDFETGPIGFNASMLPHFLSQ